MLPTQKNTYKEKTERKLNADGSYRTWGMDCIDHFRNQFNYNSIQPEIEEIQNAIEGILDRSKFEHLLNPHGLSAPKKGVKVGATLKNHNILKGIANLLIGEFGRRTHDFVVTSFNNDDESKFLQGLAEVMSAYDEQEAINSLNEAGFETNQPSVEQPPREEVASAYQTGFNEQRVLRGQNAIDYIKYNQEVDDKLVDVYYDWITVGMAYTYKCVRHNEVEYEYVPLKEIFMPRDSASRYGEDRQFAVRRRFLPVNKVLDLYNDVLEDEDLDFIHTNYMNNNSMFAGAHTMTTGRHGFIKLPTIDNTCNNNSGYYTNTPDYEGVAVDHVVWKSWKKYGILTFMAFTGEIETIQVSDDYVLNKEQGDIDIEWRWESVIWEGTCIADRIYCNVRELPECRSSLDNNGIAKLPYNCIHNNTKSGTIQSIFKDGIPYQVLMDTLHYQLEKVINKNKDKIIVMPYGLVPRKQGIDTTTMMHHADANGILWVDETAPNASYAASLIKVLDVSLGNYVKDVYEVMQMIKQAFWDSIGMNSQRYSDIAQGSGKGVTEQAIARSAIITYDLVRKMDKFCQREYQGLMDLSKLAWRDGKKGLYLLSDGSQHFLELNPDDAIYHLESDYGIIVKDSTEQTEALQNVRQLATAYAQQEGALYATTEIFTNNNLERIKGIVRTIEENNKKHELVIANANGEQQKQLQEMVNADKQADRDLDKYKADKQYQGVVDSASIRSDGKNSRDEPRPANDVEVALADHKIEKDNNAEIQEERRIQQKDKELQLKQNMIKLQAQKAKQTKK